MTHKTPLTAEELRAIRPRAEEMRTVEPGDWTDREIEEAQEDRAALLHHIDHLHGLLGRAKRELEHSAPGECWAKGKPDDSSLAALIEATVVCPGCQIVNAIDALLSGYGLLKDGGG